MAVYVPLGHGSEDIGRPRSEIPDGCSLTVIEAPGGARLINPFTEMYELEQVRSVLSSLELSEEEKLDIFRNPKANADILNEMFDSVAIFGPGDTYPNLKYNLEASWKQGGDLNKVINVRYSGVIPMQTFINPDFTTQNIVEKLKTATGEWADPEKGMFPVISHLYNSFENNDNWLYNKNEIYKFSVNPTPGDFTFFFSTPKSRDILLFGDDERYRGEIESIMNKNVKTEKEIDRVSYIDHLSKSGFEQIFIKISLETLMEKFPGHYLHIVCRGTGQTEVFKNGKYIKNPNPHENLTKTEIILRRIPYMSRQAKEQAIQNIENSKKGRMRYSYNDHSSRSIRNIMLTALKSSLVQNNLRSKFTRKNNGIERVDMTNDEMAAGGGGGVAARRGTLKTTNQTLAKSITDYDNRKKAPRSWGSWDMRNGYMGNNLQSMNRNAWERVRPAAAASPLRNRQRKTRRNRRT